MKKYKKTEWRITIVCTMNKIYAGENTSRDTSEELQEPQNICCCGSWFLQFFTCVIWSILSKTSFIYHADKSYISLSFFFLFFFCISLFRNLEICSYLFFLCFSVFFYALYLAHPSIIFYSYFCFWFCSIILNMADEKDGDGSGCM